MKNNFIYKESLTTENNSMNNSKNNKVNNYSDCKMPNKKSIYLDIMKERKDSYKKNSFRIIINHNSSKNKNNFRRIITLIITNKITFLIYCFIIKLINPISTKKSDKNRNLDSVRTINIKVDNGTKLKIINSNYIPDRIYVNGIKSTIDDSGYTNIKNGVGNIVTLEWDNKEEKYSKLFQNILSITEVNFTNFDISGISSIKSMFIGCQNLRMVNFYDFDTSSISDMESLFEGCSSLKSLDLSNFETSNLKFTNSMFKDCSSLTSLNLTNFDTPNLQRIHEMFSGCSALKYLEIPYLDTSEITNMESLFNGCTSLISLDISHFITNKVTNFNSLFNRCSSLVSIDVSNFDTSLVTDMGYMFNECYNLTSLNVSGFKTSLVENMEHMFCGCKKLTSINISNFDISEVINMNFMFFDCQSLISMDFSNFSISQKNMEQIFAGCSSIQSIKFSKEYKLVGKIDHMFSGCSSLKSLDLSNFDFALNNNLESLFKGCSSLISLNLSNIDTLSVTNMAFMFYGCKSLKTLYITNLDTTKVVSINSMFYNCSSLTSIDVSSFNTSLVTDMAYTFYNCKKLESLNLTGFNTSLVHDMDSMFEGCNSLTSLNLTNFDTSFVTNMRYMFFGCSKLTSLNLSNFITENVKDIGYMFSGCTNLQYINLYNFTDGIITSFNDLIYGNTDNLIFCLKNEEMSKQILLELKLKKCSLNDCSIDWKTKRKKIITKKGICTESCLNDDTYRFEFESFCYEKCPKGSHSSKKDKYLCETNLYECVAKYPFIFVNNRSCIEECNCKEFFENVCTINIANTNNQSILITNIINGIQEGLINNNIEKVIFGEQNDIIKEENDTLYQVTSSFNQKNKEYKNYSSLILGECEDTLKSKYSLSSQDTLIIFKTEKYIKGILIPLIEYEIFNPNSKVKLNLEYCKLENINVDFYIPVSINENISFKYDPNGTYYNDICSTYTTEFSTDIILYDRKIEFNNNSMSLCQTNCTYKGYDYVKKRALCKCQIQSRSSSKINNEQIIYKFLNISKDYNIKVLKCYQVLFSKKGLIKNIGNYIILIIIIINLFSAIYVYIKEYGILCEQINEILDIKLQQSEIETNSKKDLKFDDQLKENSTDIFTSSKKSNAKNNYSKSIIDDSKRDSNISVNNILNNNNNNKLKKKNKKKDKIMDYNDYEINTIPYKEAAENDKRTFSQCYISLIKLKHILIFTFNPKRDYNSKAIKLCLFFINLVLFILINALFFNDSLMHEIYINKGKYLPSKTLPRIIYTTIISSIIIIALKRLLLSQQNILEIKHEKIKHNLNARVLIALKRIKIKLICFFVFGILFLIFFWYYISCFCAVYMNTQIYLFKNSIITFSIALIYPFIFCLLPGILRVASLKGPGECLYKISLTIELF